MNGGFHHNPEAAFKGIVVRYVGRVFCSSARIHRVFYVDAYHE